jgi:hypothetical protein
MSPEFVECTNKKSPRPKDPEDCTRFFTLTLSPAHEGKTDRPGRFSGFWFHLLPAPSHPEDVMRHSIINRRVHLLRLTD